MKINLKKELKYIIPAFITAFLVTNILGPFLIGGIDLGYGSTRGDAEGLPFAVHTLYSPQGMFAYVLNILFFYFLYKFISRVFRPTIEQYKTKRRESKDILPMPRFSTKALVLIFLFLIEVNVLFSDDLIFSNASRIDDMAYVRALIIPTIVIFYFLFLWMKKSSQGLSKKAKIAKSVIIISISLVLAVAWFLAVVTWVLSGVGCC